MREGVIAALALGAEGGADGDSISHVGERNSGASRIPSRSLDSAQGLNSQG